MLQPAPYAELAVTSNFSFLRGASHPEELVRQAAALGHAAAAIADRNSLAGAVRAHLAAREVGIPLAVGCRLVFTPARGEAQAAPDLLVFPSDRVAYARLCRLLTRGNLRAPKGACELHVEDLECTDGLLAVVMPPRPGGDGALPELPDERFAREARRLVALFGPDAVSLGAAMLGGPDDEALLRGLGALAEALRVPLCALNDVHYHAPARRPLQDVLTCIRTGRTLEQAGLALFPNAERCLKPPAAMARLFRSAPAALARAAEVAARAARFSLADLDYVYPGEAGDALRELRERVRAGARERYPAGLPSKVAQLLEHEQRLIAELGYAPYFLTVHGIVRFARERGILHQGRGAAANSAVCYCLGVTAVDPSRSEMLFERFISKDRNEPPDIDIDFEHERREEVIQFLYGKYGRERAALTATVITYRGRSAVRDVGKALGCSQDLCERVAGDLDGWHESLGDPERLRALGLDPSTRTAQCLLEITGAVLGFPRHLSQHVGGFVVTADPLCELVPIANAAMEGRTVIEWDKDDLDALGILKIDVLGLGMLTAIARCGALIGDGAADGFELAGLPAEDPAVYDMLCAADTIGVFQVESRAQMAMLPRLKPRCFYDLVIEIAIVRPGPIHGDMVHPYLRRRSGLEPVEYPGPDVREVLERTLGVPLFQEQAMRLAVVAGGFTPGEADRLRRALAAWRRKTSAVQELGAKLVRGMLERGYAREFAERTWRQLEGFSEYGFPESHAASFALLVYVSAWLKLYHPAAFAAALLNSQPMGFYAPAQLVRDAREHGVEVRPIDVNHSAWDCTLEARDGAEGSSTGARGPALRLGMRLVKGLRRDSADAVALAARQRGPFRSPAALHAAAGVSARSLRPLAYADAFGSMDLDRRAAAWALGALRDAALPLFAREASGGDEVAGAERLPTSSELEEMLHDYASQQLSCRAHPLSFLRETLDRRGVVPATALLDAQRFPHKAPVCVAGLVLVRQRPATASGIVFVTLEDETGVANLVVHPDTYERHRRATRHAALLLARGRIDRAEGVVHVVAYGLEELGLERRSLRSTSRDFH